MPTHAAGVRFVPLPLFFNRSRKMTEAKKVKTIMGIDPGTNYTGYGVVEVCGRDVKCVVLGYIELHKVTDVYQKLRHIFDCVSQLIEQYGPDEVALESPFFGENVQSMLKLGRAQGVAMAAALTRGLPVFEYAPRRIKQSITGNGGASKEQVAAMLKNILKVEYSLKKLDATDGLAVALCHHYETCSPLSALAEGGEQGSLKEQLKAMSKGKMSWEAFVAKNPGREAGAKGCKPGPLKTTKK